jgi:phosphoglycerate dehydrogenase-like enzyme
VRVFTERGADQEQTLIERIGDAEVVVNIRAHARFTDRVLAACPTLRLISIWGAGTDNVDLAACKARGITVTNTPGVNAHALAEHTIALMLAATRRIPAMDRDVRAGQWPRGLLTQLEGRTLGLIGLGAIGSRVAALAKPFGMRMLASTFGPDKGRAAALGAQHVSVEQLLRESDIVSLHLRLSADTQGYLGKQRLALMKPTAFLINTSRGGNVDQDALIRFCTEGRIAGAGIDVTDPEPLPPGHPLFDVESIVISPHIAGGGDEYLSKMGESSATNALGVLRGKRPFHLLNPDVWPTLLERQSANGNR